MPLAPAIATRSYRVFLSSGSDVAELRDRTDILFQLANAILVVEEDIQARVEVDRWEHGPAHRGTTGRLNEEFVKRAKRAHLTVALLRREIRAGTFEELTAVLEDTDRDIAVIWFHDPTDVIDPGLTAFLEKYQHKIQYSEAGPPEDDSAWNELVKVLLFFVIRIMGAP